MLLGSLLQRRLRDASKQSQRQSDVFLRFTNLLKPENVKEWTVMVTAFEPDQMCLDPYRVSTSGMSSMLSQYSFQPAKTDLFQE